MIYEYVYLHKCFAFVDCSFQLNSNLIVYMFDIESITFENSPFSYAISKFKEEHNA
jgi:hypothetical protein